MAPKVQSGGVPAGRPLDVIMVRPPVGTVAARGFSGVPNKVITSPQVLESLKGVFGWALKLAV